jgi:undecaprenyl-diphosphatase
MNFNRRAFFALNHWVGRNRYLDMFGKFAAEYAVVLLVAIYSAAIIVRFFPDYSHIARLAFFSVLAWCAGWGLNLFIGLVVREPRPHKTHAHSKLLFTPMMSWKSFPSDHAMSAWLFFFLSLVLVLPVAPGLFVLAIIVSWGRVFAGVHYPLDIAGGMLVAALVTAFGRVFF